MRLAVSAMNMIVDGQPAEEVKIGEKVYSVRKMITEDLRSIKKKQINGKDEQKNILNGRSPDFGDSLSMICLFDLEGVS